MPRKSHNSPHKYIKRPFGAGHVWACALPSCSHYMPPHLSSMIEGKTSLCNQCGEEFILTVDSLKEVSPRCDDCRFGHIKTEDDVPITSVMEEFLKGNG